MCEFPTADAHGLIQNTEPGAGPETLLFRATRRRPSWIAGLSADILSGRRQASLRSA